MRAQSCKQGIQMIIQSRLTKYVCHLLLTLWQQFPLTELNLKASYHFALELFVLWLIFQDLCSDDKIFKRSLRWLIC